MHKILQKFVHAQRTALSCTKKYTRWNRALHLQSLQCLYFADNASKYANNHLLGLREMLQLDLCGLG